MTLAEHVQRLFDERANWLREPPADMPDWAHRAFVMGRPGRLEAAAAIDAEINDAIVLMRKLGWLPGRGEMSEFEQPAGALSEGDAAQP